MRIQCPNCGERAIEEFTYRGAAAPERPALNAPLEAHFAYVYIRANPAGRHLEHWHHAGGCRAWLVVERSTISHEICSVRLAEDREPQGAGAGQ